MSWSDQSRRGQKSGRGRELDHGPIRQAGMVEGWEEYVAMCSRVGGFPKHPITGIKEPAGGDTLECPRTLVAPSFPVQGTTRPKVRGYSDRQFSLVAVVLLAPLLVC